MILTKEQCEKLEDDEWYEYVRKTLIPKVKKDVGFLNFDKTQINIKIKELIHEIDKMSQQEDIHNKLFEDEINKYSSGVMQMIYDDEIECTICDDTFDYIELRDELNRILDK